MYFKIITYVHIMYVDYEVKFYTIHISVNITRALSPEDRRGSNAMQRYILNLKKYFIQSRTIYSCYKYILYT